MIIKKENIELAHAVHAALVKAEDNEHRLAALVLAVDRFLATASIEIDKRAELQVAVNYSAGR
jgi:hypothetical protein